MEQRLLLAFVLMGLVLFLTPYFYKAPPPPPKTATSPSAQPAHAGSSTQPGTKAATATQPAASTAASAQPLPGQIEASSEQQFEVDTAIYHITLSNRGGTVRSWVLKKYRDHAGKPLELVNPASYSKVAPPFSLVLRDDKAADALNYGLYVAKPAENGLGIQYDVFGWQELRAENVPVFKERLSFPDHHRSNGERSTNRPSDSMARRLWRLNGRESRG